MDNLKYLIKSCHNKDYSLLYITRFIVIMIYNDEPTFFSDPVLMTASTQKKFRYINNSIVLLIDIVESSLHLIPTNKTK